MARLGVWSLAAVLVLVGCGSDATEDGDVGSAGAAVATHNGQLVLVTTSDHNLYMSTSTGNGWTQPRQIVGQKSKSAPALASYGGYLHMTHLGDTSNSIWWSTWDGTSWAANVSIPGQQSRWAPSLASAGGKLFQAHIGGTSDSLYYSTFQ